MSDQRGTIRHISWSDVCPCLLLGRTFRLAVGVRALLLAAIALVGSAAGWRVDAWLFQNSSDLKTVDWLQRDGIWPWEAQQALTTDHWPTPWGGDLTQTVIHNPIVIVWEDLTEPFRRLFDVRLTFTQLAYLVLGCLWTLLVWAFFGGAITRIAAVALTREDRLTFLQSVRFAQSKWPSYFFGPLFPFIGILLVTIPTTLFGLLLRLDFGVLIGSLLWPVILVLGAIVTVVVLGLGFGWPLMWGTISVEGTDHFDGLSRAYNYIRERPLHYVFYVALAGLLGLLGWWVVMLFAWGVVHLTTWAVSWGSGVDRIQEILHPGSNALGLPVESAASPGWMLGFGTQLIGFWNSCVFILAVAFSFSYFWVASTAIYLLLRRHVDGTELDEVQLDDDDGTYGLPPLVTDAAGVAGVADEKGGSPAADLAGEE